MMQMLTEEASQQLDEILDDLVKQAEADAAFLCDRGGNIIARRAVARYAQEENFAALASGAFFASLEMARLVGESEFHSMLQQGQKKSIYMQKSPGDMLLVVVFGVASNPGLIKLHTGQTVQKLGQSSLCVDMMDAAGHPQRTLVLELDESADAFR